MGPIWFHSLIHILLLIIKNDDHVESGMFFLQIGPHSTLCRNFWSFSIWHIAEEVKARPKKFCLMAVIFSTANNLKLGHTNTVTSFCLVSSILFHSFHSRPFHSVLFRSVSFHSVHGNHPFLSISFCSNPFHSDKYLYSLFMESIVKTFAV